MDTLGFGLVLVSMGVALVLVVRLLSRTRPQMPTPADFSPGPDLADRLDENTDALLVVQPSGRMGYLNPAAREMFHLQESERPDFERLARRVRPTEAFLALCLAEGHAHLSIDARLYSATSYCLVFEPHPLMVLTLRPAELGLVVAQGSVSSQTLQTFTELTQTMASSLDLEATLQAILDCVGKLFPAELIEITLWDEENSCLVPYRYGLGVGISKVEATRQRYQPRDGYSGYLFRERKALLISDIDQFTECRPALDRRVFPLRSYIGIPLEIGSDFIGTLELGSAARDTFQSTDMDLLRLLSGQAAIALNNAILYQVEKQRTVQLSGLSHLAQTFGAGRDSRVLFSRLVESISLLLKVEVIGFLLYRESHRILEAQVPFMGLPQQVVELYRTTVEPGSVVENKLLDQDVLISENAATDEQWRELHLDFLAQAASLRDTVLVPLNSGGRMMGYLQVSNHLNGSTFFSQNEMNLLMIIANQAAAIIENSELVQQSRLRAARAETLRRLAGLVNAASPRDESLAGIVRELARLLKARRGALYVSNPSGGVLQLHQASCYGVQGDQMDGAVQLFVEDPQYPFSVTASQRPLILGQLQTEQVIIPFYQSLLLAWDTELAISVPIFSRDEGIGELWFGSPAEGMFDQGDAQVLATAASQIARLIEQPLTHMGGDQELYQRLDLLAASARIGRELSRGHELKTLLQLIYEEARRVTRVERCTVLAFDPRPFTDPLAVWAQAGDTLSSALRPLQQMALEKGESLLVHDLNQVGLPSLPGVESLLVAPLFCQGRQAGQLVLLARSVEQLNNTVLDILKALQDQVEAAFESAFRYEQQAQRAVRFEESLMALRRLAQDVRQNSVGDRSQMLATVGNLLHQTMPFRVILISLFEAPSALKAAWSIGYSNGTWEMLQANPRDWAESQLLLSQECRRGSVYWISTRQPLNGNDAGDGMLSQPATSALPEGDWMPGDQLLMLLTGRNGDMLGLIELDAPADDRWPDSIVLDALDVYGQYVSLVIEAQMYTSQLIEQKTELESEQVRLQRALSQAQQGLPALLHRDLEQASLIRQLSYQVERFRTTLEIAENANRQANEPAVLQVLGRELLQRFEMSVVLVAERTSAGARLVQVIGSVPPGANPEALFGQRNPLRQLLQDNHLIVVADILEAPEWQNIPLLNVLEARSLIGLPLGIGDQRAVGVLAIGTRPLALLGDEDRRLFGELARQVSVSLQDLQLLEEIWQRLREVDLLLNFSRKLVSLEPGRLLSTLVESIQEVVGATSAAWVGLWEEKASLLMPHAAVGYKDEQSLFQVSYSFPVPVGEALSLPLRVMRYGLPERISEINLAEDYCFTSAQLLKYQKATGERLPLSALAVPLQLGEKVLGALVIENFDLVAAFSEQDETLVLSFAQQAVLALENARLYQNIQQRAGQLQALTHVAGKLTASLQSDELIAILLEQLNSVLPYRTGTIWLRSGERLRVVSAKGFDDDSRRLGLQASVQDSLLFLDMENGQPIYVPDVRKDDRFPSMIEPEHLSWLGIPLVAKSQLIGLIALEEHEMDSFSQEAIQAAMTFAGQAAVALENARLYEESVRRAADLDERSQRLALLNRLSSELAASLDVDYILQLASQQLISGFGGAAVTSVLIERVDEAYLCALEAPLEAGQNEATRLLLPEMPLFSRLFQSFGVFTSNQSQAEPDLALLCKNGLILPEANSVLIVPMVTVPKLHGWLVLQAVKEQRFNLSEIEMVRTICNQAAIAIQNARLFDETRRLTEDLERRVQERTAELRREHHNSQTLLRISTELSTSLEMSLVLNNALHALNQAVGSEESLIILSDNNKGEQNGGTKYRAGLELAQPAEVLNGATQPEQEIARWVMRLRRSAVIEDVTLDGRWNISAADGLAYRSVTAVPLVLGEEVLGTLVLFHRQPGFFTPEQVSLIEAAAHQISVALNNAELFGLIRAQSEQLGVMLRAQQIETSRSRAILEAVADGVVVTDATGKVQLFNASAEQIFELDSNQVIGQEIEQVFDLHGKEAHEWRNTVRNWTDHPLSAQAGDTFSGDLDLDNEKIVAIHLAPVFLRSEFLGTVTIFRDITYEVKVDRMKSEFLANVSHELRTPLTSIKGYVEIMLMGAAGTFTTQQDQFLRIIKTNTERLSMLVIDLLDVSRIESGRVTLSLQSVNLGRVAEAVASEVLKRAADEDRPMNISLEIPADLPPVRADLERTRQIVNQLVTNGYLYTPAGGQIWVRLHKVGDEVQVDVKDNGIGIDFNDQPRIFERFFRGEDPLVLASAGNGLGLSLAKTLVEMHNGRIWFYSSGVSGEGSTFSFTLPIHSTGEQE